jgi:hypothetical protein
LIAHKLLPLNPHCRDQRQVAGHLGWGIVLQPFCAANDSLPEDLPGWMNSMQRPDRYQLYFWIVNLTTVCVFSTAILSTGFASPFLRQHFWIAMLSQLAFVGAFFLPMVIMLASRMRDEFADDIWRSAAQSTVKGLVFLPLLAIFAVATIDGIRHASHASGTAWGRFVQSITMESLSAVYALQLLWITILSIYVITFQWHRWRASQ